MTLQQQQPGVVLSGERPIMPVVSMGGVGVGVAALQMNQVQTPQMQTVQQLQLPVIFLIEIFCEVYSLCA